MPTAPSADSPFMPSRVEAALGVFPSGTAGASGKPGVQAADVSFPSPPGIATAPNGRPPGAQTPTPTMPTAPTPTATAATAPPTQQPRQPAQGGAGAPPAPAATPGAALAPVAPAPSVVPSTDAFNQPQLAITPEGAQRYREAVVRVRGQLGSLPRIFSHPSLPEMPAEPGKWNWNPFTGSWAK